MTARYLRPKLSPSASLRYLFSFSVFKLRRFTSVMTSFEFLTAFTPIRVESASFIFGVP